MLYAAWAEAGTIPIEDLKNLRKIDSPLEGHPTPVSGCHSLTCHCCYINNFTISVKSTLMLPLAHWVRD